MGRAILGRTLSLQRGKAKGPPELANLGLQGENPSECDDVVSSNVVDWDGVSWDGNTEGSEGQNKF